MTILDMASHFDTRRRRGLFDVTNTIDVSLNCRRKTSQFTRDTRTKEQIYKRPTEDVKAIGQKQNINKKGAKKEVIVEEYECDMIDTEIEADLIVNTHGNDCEYIDDIYKNLRRQESSFVVKTDYMKHVQVFWKMQFDANGILDMKFISYRNISIQKCEQYW